MRAELGKESHNVVFVLGGTFGVPSNNVMIYVYKGMCRVSSGTHDIKFARNYWRTLVAEGYHTIPPIRDAQG